MFGYRTRPSWILTFALMIGSAALGALGVVFIKGGLRQAAAPAASSPAVAQHAAANRQQGSDGAGADVASRIAAELAKLDIKPRTIELPSEKARRARDAINHHDYAAARQIVTEVLAASHLQNWRFYPFSDFMANISDKTNADFEARLDEWVAAQPSDPIPSLLRAQYYYDIGWATRGQAFSKYVQRTRLHSFAEYMNKALADADAAIVSGDKNPYEFYLKLQILRGYGRSQRATDAFDAAIAQFPGYFRLYEVALSTIEPRWGGSIDAMYALVDRYAGHAPENSPLKLLYLSLYRDLLSSASAACTSYWREAEKMAQCVATVMGKFVRPELEKQVVSALRLYDTADKHQFTVAIEPILQDMLLVNGGDVYSGAILQLAADAMHSDAQLNEDKPEHKNNYVIDKLVARSWYYKKFYDNAKTKYDEAIRDIAVAPFPNEEEKYIAVASIYGEMAGLYNKTSQYMPMIAYQKAAMALGDESGGEPLIAWGYYKLKDFDAAIAAGTATINRTGDMQARYWRGSAYRDAGNPEAAVRDFAAVADSESNFRESAAINLGMIYSNQKDYQTALTIMNKYTYLYNPDLSERDTVAIAYNNRCYFYMQLGQLQKALDDCTESLKYGSLPDAYRKQQELVKRLGAK